MIKDIQLQNLGTENKNRVVLKTEKGEFIFYFSYKTMVAFEYWVDVKQNGQTKHQRCIHTNDWSTTTGKLLNELEPDKKSRIDEIHFNEELKNLKILLNA